MEYQVFALKYRPQNFDEIVGQEHVVSALKRAIQTKRLHHAYLFSGPRGVGKTSLARVLAKALNCLKGPTISPCQECLSCKEIAKGTSLDVIEIDGASNRGIEDIKSLRESVKLAPSYSRYKIYIIDEVHQITSDGFNALLKTLEEPPLHVKFIFATTHPHKIPPTILSRCQKFQFHLLSAEKIVEKLKRIVEKEKIDINEELLYSIAKASSGSIRDAESLLDQIVPVVVEKELDWDITSLLGIVEEESLNKMVKFIIEKNLTEALEFIDKLLREGKDLANFVNFLIEHIKNLILARLSPKAFKEIDFLSPQTKKFLSKHSELISIEEALKIIDFLIESKENSKKLNSLRIPFELALIKFCYSPSLKPTTSSDSQIKKTPSSSLEMLEKEIEEVLAEKEKDEDISEEKTEETEEKEKVICEEELKEKWPIILEEVKKTKVTLASHLCEAQISVEDNFLKIGFFKQHAFHKEVLEKQNNRKILEKIIEKNLNKPVRIKFVLIEDKKEIPQNDEPQDADFINELLDTFEGKIDHPNE